MMPHSECARRAAYLSTRKLFFGPLAEGGGHFVLLYPRRRVAALTQVLLFCAVTHHAGMSNLSSLLSLMRGRGFLRHAKLLSAWGLHLKPNSEHNRIDMP